MGRLHSPALGPRPRQHLPGGVAITGHHPTVGLRDLLTEVLGRLTGKRPNASPIIRLETAFGGGKTHNLIALYHVAIGHRRPPRGW
jgi:hypothetical protein